MTASSKRNVAKKPALVQALADVVRMPCSRRWNSQARDVDCRVWRFRRGGLRKLCCNFLSLLRVSRCRHRRSLVEESIHVHLDGDHSSRAWTSIRERHGCGLLARIRGRNGPHGQEAR
jgi:hypothetical protein